MTDEELHKIAKKTAIYGVSSGENIYMFYTEQLQAFAKLIAKHEREACAKVCENQADDQTEGEWDGCCLTLAKHIRARGQA